MAYRASLNHNSMQQNDIRVSELSHDGGFLEELDPVVL